jgi:hypothetical protein
MVMVDSMATVVAVVANGGWDIGPADAFLRPLANAMPNHRVYRELALQLHT